MGEALVGESFEAARERRRREVRSEPKLALRRQKQFFFDLEEAAHGPEVAASVDAVHQAGQARLLERLRGERAGRDPERERIRGVAGLVHELLAQHFPAPGGNTEHRAVFSALLRFGDAQLRSIAAPPGVLLHHNGEPNGPEFFLFGELGLMCLRAGVDIERWTGLLPALLGPQAAFCARYSNGPLRHVTGYRPVHARDAPSVDPESCADEFLSMSPAVATARSTRVGRAAFRIFPSGS